jgi:hypothetical protein
MSDEPVDVVLSVGALDAAVVAVRELLHRTGALEVQGLVDRGEQEPALVLCGRATPIAVTADDRTVHLPHAAELGPAPPALPAMPMLPPLEADAEEGRVTGPLGAVAALADGVQALAGILGGRSVALALFATTDADLPLGIAARAGEQPLLTIGDHQFELPPSG